MAPTERTEKTRGRRRARNLRKLRLIVPDPNSPSVRQRVAQQVAMLAQPAEQDALTWIEAVSIFDEPGE